MLTGAAPRLYFDTQANQWKLVIEATMFVTGAVVNVWSGSKSGGTDPVGTYTRVSGCDPAAALTVTAGAACSRLTPLAGEFILGAWILPHPAGCPSCC